MNPYSAHHHENALLKSTCSPTVRRVVKDMDQSKRGLLPRGDDTVIAVPVTPSPQKIQSESLKKELDEELMGAVEQAQKDRIDAMVTQWRIKQKLIKAMEELEEYKKRQKLDQERHEKELRACRERRAREHREQMQFYKFERMFASDETNSLAMGPVNYGIKESRSRLGNYKIGKMMGEGYYSQVHIGSHFRTRMNYAIKKLPKKNITDSCQMERVRTEINVLRNARHPNIVSLHEVVHTPKNICLVMELGAQDLQQFCSQHFHHIEELPLREIVTGILEPLAYLHSKGIAHMDLKPENIILSDKVIHPCYLSRHHIKLCDFGLCVENPLASLEHVKNKNVYIHGFWGGTPGFFAPEMVLRKKGMPCEARRADMWSVGCTMLELSPEGFPGGKWIDTYRLYKTDRRGFRQGLWDSLDILHRENYFMDKAFGDLVKRLLRMDPRERLTSAEAKSHFWLTKSQLNPFDNGDEIVQPMKQARLITASPDKPMPTL